MKIAVQRQRYNDGPPPKPDFINQNELKVNASGGFDEADRKKFEALAEPFLNDVSNLPKVLQETINSNHSKNAASLVLNKKDLREATELLGEIEARLVGALREAQDIRMNEQEVSDKLRSIDLNNDKDTKAIANRQKVSEALKEIYQDAAVSDYERGLLENPDFRNPQKVDEVFQIVLKLTREVERKDVPPSLVGLKAATERISIFKDLLNKYSEQLVIKIGSKLANRLDIIKAEAERSNFPVEYIPPSFDELFAQKPPEENEEKKEEAEPQNNANKDKNKGKNKDKNDQSKEVKVKEKKADKDGSDNEADGSDSDNDESEKSASDDDDNSSDNENDENASPKSKKRHHHHKKSSTSKRHSRSSKHHKSSRHSRSSKDLTEKKIELKPPPIVQSDDPRKKFSIKEVADHPILRFLNIYWKHIRWAQKYHYKDCYLSLQNSYIKMCSKVYLKEDFNTKFIGATDILGAFKRSLPLPTDPFSIDDDYLTPQSNKIVAHITSLLYFLFKKLKIEECILTEFWNISDPQTLAKIIPVELLQYMNLIMLVIKTYDPIYLIVAHSICSNKAEGSIIPVDNIVQIPRKEWNQVINEQLNEMKSNKLSKSKDNVSKVFQDIPKYIKALIHISPKDGTHILEKTIARILEEIVNYLTENAFPKGTKKSKAAQLIIVNLVCLTDEFNKDEELNKGKESLFQKSDIIKDKMKSINDLLNDNIQAFLESMAETAWPEPYQFFYQIEEWMKQEGFTYEIVTFQETHTPEKFKELNEKIDKKINASINNCNTFLKNKIEAENLRNELKKSVVSNVAKIFQRWSDLAEKCYGTPLITTSDKVTQLMQNY